MYLGQWVSVERAKPSNQNVQKKILDIPLLTTYTQIWEFIGMANHYHWFIKDFSKISQPLHEYTEGEGAKKKKEALELTPEAVIAINEMCYFSA